MANLISKYTVGDETAVVHTGDVTGGTNLLLSSTSITSKTATIPESGDKLLFSDSSDSGNLKQCDFDDLGGGGSTTTIDDIFMYGGW